MGINDEIDNDEAYMAELREHSRRFRERIKDPQKYLADMDEQVRQNPTDPNAYSGRSYARELVGRRDLAIADINAALELVSQPNPALSDHERAFARFRTSMLYEERACVLRDLGRYREALDDLNRAEATDPQEWAAATFGLLFRADTHARLGNEAAALADCARLPEDHWTPGLMGAPQGNKAKVAAELRRRAALARQRNASSDGSM